MPDAGIAAETNFIAELGGRVELPCEFKVGRYRHLYTYRWYRNDDDHIVYPSSEESDRKKYGATVDYALSISDVDPSDNGNAFYCTLEVNTKDIAYTNKGSVKKLEVYSE